MIYLLFIADSFRDSALDELKGAAKYRVLAEQHNLIIADIGRMDGTKALDRARFIYSYFPIYLHSALGTKGYMLSLYRGISRLKLDKRAGTRLECFDVNCKQGYSAKDIEVEIGGKLEKAGYKIDLANPEILAYCILIGRRCYFGYVKLSSHPHGFINPFRHGREKYISRAEFKIMEAFREFKLAAPRIAIDLGAAPGGWSLFLASSGSSVIAVDGGSLEYVKIRSTGVSISAAPCSGRRRISQEKLAPGSITHLKCRTEKAAEILRNIRADFLGNDMNIGGMDSSRAVISYSRFMEKNAVLIMTVKCMHRNVGRYMGEVEAILRPKFRIMRWKVLPHNRQEITLFAMKK